MRLLGLIILMVLTSELAGAEIGGDLLKLEAIRNDAGGRSFNELHRYGYEIRNCIDSNRRGLTAEEIRYINKDQHVRLGLGEHFYRIGMANFDEESGVCSGKSNETKTCTDRNGIRCVVVAPGLDPKMKKGDHGKFDVLQFLCSQLAIGCAREFSGVGDEDLVKRHKHGY